MPNIAFGAPDDMYVRYNSEKVSASFAKRDLSFNAGGEASFDTFYNGFTIHHWKKHCKVDDLSLRLEGTGRFNVRFGVHRLGAALRWLDEIEVSLSDSAPALVEIKQWADYDEGILFFAVRALEAGTITGGAFVTNTAPQRQVKLGISVTHFNRKAYVIPAINRIRDELLNDPRFSGQVELIVVDNSQNISAEEAAGVTVIPNQNYGGSGGFMRGLLHLKDSGFTHGLFMDDDASCEIESIRRSIRFAEYKIAEDLMIAGALTLDVGPWRVIDKGSRFHNAPRSDKAGLDVRGVYDLLLAEDVREPVEFGGWWFLFFNVSCVQHYSYPFFVKCDDILFGLQHHVEKVTLNGVSCFSEDFGYKDGPLQRYLDTRNRMVLGVIGDYGKKSTLMLAARFFLIGLFSHNYASAAAARLGLQDFLSGPKFFVDNLDMADVRKKIADLGADEKLKPIDRSKLDLVYPGGHESRLHRWGRLLTLNGMLLPESRLINRVAYQDKGLRGTLRDIFRFKQVLYYYAPLGVGYVVSYDRKKFFSELSAYVSLWYKFFKNYNKISKDYRDSLNDMTSEAFWRGVYETKSESK